MPASNPPAPPSKCPVMDFVELIGTCLARSPKTRLSARVSMTSPSGVEVPCAFTYPISSGVSFASLIAHGTSTRSEEHTSELQSHLNLVCRLLLEKKKKQQTITRKSRRSNTK